MALTVNTNTAAINALTNYQHTNRSLNSSFQKISSGLRITKAADDAAGLGVAENLDAQTKSMRQAKRNINDGISIIQTVEGAVSEIINLHKRARELLVEGSSETLHAAERSYVGTEISAINSEIARIGEIVEFNGIKLANNDSTKNVQVGIHNTSNDRIGIVLQDIRTNNYGGGHLIWEPNPADNASDMRDHLPDVDTDIDYLNNYRSTLGATQNRLTSALNNIETSTENLSSAQSQIRDADFAHETAQMAKFQIMAQAGTSVLAQANQINQGALRLLG